MPYCLPLSVKDHGAITLYGIIGLIQLKADKELTLELPSEFYLLFYHHDGLPKATNIHHDPYGNPINTHWRLILYNMTDMFFVGQLGDYNQVAAVSVVSPLFSLSAAVVQKHIHQSRSHTPYHSLPDCPFRPDDRTQRCGCQHKRHSQSTDTHISIRISTNNGNIDCRCVEDASAYLLDCHTDHGECSLPSVAHRVQAQAGSFLLPKAKPQ